MNIQPSSPLKLYEDDVDKVIGCTPVILNQLHANGLRECIAKISSNLKNLAAIETNFDRFNQYLAIYSTEPRLLDPVLPEFVNSLVGLINLRRDEENEPFFGHIEEAFRFLKSLALLCSYKLIASLLPHDVSFLRPLLSALEFYVNEVRTSKHVIYVLQIWLYIVCKNPFDLARLSKEHSLVGTGLDSLSQRLIKVLKKIQLNYNQDTSFYRLTPNLLAQILTRNKDNSEILGPQIKESVEVLQIEDDGTLLRAHLSLLSSIFKFGKRAELLPYAEEIFTCIRMSIFEGSACYFAAKLYQRLALVFLPPKLAPWRYKRGYRSLEANLAVRKDESVPAVPTEEASTDEDETFFDMDSIEKIPKILETFLLLLRNDTDSVRTTSAKALGRICARFLKNQTDFVIQRILKDNFSEHGTASAWHGGCLALAELSGRGCFLPQHLKDVVPLIGDALLYDHQCNGNVTEANVRDAACYICWSFARAYGLDVLEEHVDLLSQRLICTALFDREINVRRAASASFQENVGRHGGFLNGIQVLIIIDFIAVGKIRHCFEEACVQVAQYSKYRRPLLDHLCRLKCVYWDEKIRLLSATAIERMVPLDKKYAIDTLLPLLCDNLKKCNEFDKMQGYLMAISAIIRGLSPEFKETFRQSTPLYSVCEFIPQHLGFGQFSIKGFSYLIRSSCDFVETILKTDLELNKGQISQFVGILEHVLQNPDDLIRQCSANALSALFGYCNRNGHPEFLNAQKYLRMIQRANSEVIQISCILSLNCLPKEMFIKTDEGSRLFLELFDCFSQIILAPTNQSWYLSRIYALKSLTQLMQMRNTTSLIDCDAAFKCLSKCINDQTKTKQGDVGRHVREAALQYLKSILETLIEIDSNFEDHLDKSVAFILQRCSDGVDKTRTTAIKTMIDLLNSNNFRIKEAEHLRDIFLGADTNALKGAAPFLPLDRLLNLEPYRPYLLRGLILPMGSILAWTAEHSQQILDKHLKPIKHNRERMEFFVKELLEIGEEFSQDEDDSFLFFNALQRVSSDGLFSVFESDPDSSVEFKKLCEFIQAGLKKRAKPKFRHVVIKTLGSLLTLRYDSKTAQTIRSKLVSLLSSPYNSLRAMAAEQLLIALSMLNEEIFSRQNIQEANSLLETIDWSEQIDTKNFEHPTLKIHDLLK